METTMQLWLLQRSIKTFVFNLNLSMDLLYFGMKETLHITLNELENMYSSEKKKKNTVQAEAAPCLYLSVG